jgi:uncharacterized membrane protein YhaH (DUF805 family)
MEWTCLLFSFRGRISRQEFWLKFTLPALMTLIVVILYAGPLWFDKALLITIAVLLWPWLAVGTKRCHDCNRSGWLQLIWLVPAIGPLLLLCYLGAAKGTSGPNRFGP